MASPTSINKLQVMQNAARRVCSGCTHDTNIHLHEETNILHTETFTITSLQVRQKAQYPSHPLHRYTTHNTSQRLKNPTTLTTPDTSHTSSQRHKSKHARHTYKHYLSLQETITNKSRTHPPQVSSTEDNLPRHMRHTLAQLRTINPFSSYHIYTKSMPQHTHHHSAPPCCIYKHTTQHLFSCPQTQTTLWALDL